MSSIRPRPPLAPHRPPTPRDAAAPKTAAPQAQCTIIESDWDDPAPESTAEPASPSPLAASSDSHTLLPPDAQQRALQRLLPADAPEGPLPLWPLAATPNSWAQMQMRTQMQTQRVWVWPFLPPISRGRNAIAINYSPPGRNMSMFGAGNVQYFRHENRVVRIPVICARASAVLLFQHSASRADLSLADGGIQLEAVQERINTLIGCGLVISFGPARDPYYLEGLAPHAGLPQVNDVPLASLSRPNKRQRPLQEPAQDSDRQPSSGPTSAALPPGGQA
jgi:hypothetical protein